MDIFNILLKKILASFNKNKIDNLIGLNFRDYTVLLSSILEV